MSGATNLLQRGLRSAQPLPAAVVAGTLYCVTDEDNLVEQSTGAAWVAYGTSGTGSGDVVGPGSSTDNAIARFNGTGGKTLQNSTPTVEDDGRVATVTDPTGLQDAATKNYVDQQIAAVNVGGAAQTSFLVSGGQVVWDSAYTFLVSASTYYINGVLYSAAGDSVTLGAADPSDDRIDVIAVDDGGNVVVVPGVAAAQPSEPDIDPGTQLKLSIVLVSAGTSAPVGASSTLLYADNAGSPTEWNWTASAGSINVNSTNNPRSGTKSIEGTAVVAGVYAQGQIGSGTFDPNGVSTLVIYIRSKATWANKRGLQVTLRNAGVLVGVAVSIERSGTWGFDSSVTGSYQQVAIPTSMFAVPVGTLIDQVRIADFGGSIGFYLDDLSFQGGATSQPSNGITQEQADARYRRLSVPLVLSSSADVSGDLPLANLAPASAASRFLVRGSGSGAGDWQEGTFGTGLSLSGSTLSATGSGGDVVGPASSVASELVLFDGTTGKLIKRATGTGIVRVTSGVYGTPGNVNLASEVTGTLPVANIATLPNSGIDITIDGGGSAITTGVKLDVELPFAGTWTAWRVFADQSGSIVLDIWKDTYANYPPTVADTITASAKPTLSSATKNQDTTLTGWTTSFSAGDTLRINVDSVATVTRVTLALRYTRT